MHTVLIVDDERSFLLSVADGLAAMAPEFTVLTAGNGRRATEVLERQVVDLVVTDLKMPLMDGFELIAYLSHKSPQTPVLVMSAYSTPEIEERLSLQGITSVLDKPLALDDLALRIRDALAAGSEGHIQGFSLATFLQLVNMDRKTCTLVVHAGGQAGHLYLVKGELVGAETGELTGASAALEVLAWDGASIDVERVCARSERTIEEPLNHLLFEAVRLKDERARHRPVVLTPAVPAVSPHADSAAELAPRISQETKMALENHIKALKEIKGFKAAGIMNYTGEVLAAESVDPSIDLALVGATFNDIFRSAHEACRAIGLDACKETVISTPKGIIVMRCSGVEAKVHYHLIAVMSFDGNQALMKMQMEKLVAPIMADLG